MQRYAASFYCRNDISRQLQANAHVESPSTAATATSQYSPGTEQRAATSVQSLSACAILSWSCIVETSRTCCCRRRHVPHECTIDATSQPLCRWLVRSRSVSSRKPYAYLPHHQVSDGALPCSSAHYRIGPHVKHRAVQAAAAATDKPVILVSEKLGSAGDLPAAPSWVCCPAQLGAAAWLCHHPIVMCRFGPAEPIWYSRLQLRVNPTAVV